MLEFVTGIVRAAGQLIHENYEQVHRINRKSSEIDLVTEVDLAVEQLLVSAILERFPGHAILSEEGHGVQQTSDYLWVLDPLDGTVNYAHGFPIFAVSVAVQQRDETILGVIYDPLRDEMFAAEKGAGATRNDQPIHVSATDRLQDALLATGFPYDRATRSDNNVAEFNHLITRVQGIRRAGAATLDMAYLAAGRLDGYWEQHLSPWDWAAGVLLVAEAGGVITDFDGGPWGLDTVKIVVTNGRIHEELLRGLGMYGRTDRARP
ncbi:MAG: inositol monophosphatase family protein [Anaerolineae bacterium]